MIDLRSDTVTVPTPEMREVMARAEVGDDVFGEDPLVNRLQAEMAHLTGKEAALFVPSGTMGNQVCIKTHTQPGDEIITERNSHIFNYECGSPALLSSVQVMPIQGIDGHFTLEQLKEVIRPDNIHHPTTRLICIENTHNRAGGAIFPLKEIQRIYEFAQEKQLKMHLDGARLWNASVATGIPIKEYCRYFDSISLCFSKGLGAPVGSIIVGSREFIKRARYFRKAFGGGMRQAGILAAAALFAVQNNLSGLVYDHLRARCLAEALAEIPGIDINLKATQTNIVIFDVKNTGLTAQEVTNQLAEKGIRMLAVSGTRLRAVTHFQVSDADIKQTIKALNEIFRYKTHE